MRVNARSRRQTDTRYRIGVLLGHLRMPGPGRRLAEASTGREKDREVLAGPAGRCNQSQGREYPLGSAFIPGGAARQVTRMRLARTETADRDSSEPKACRGSEARRYGTGTAKRFLPLALLATAAVIVFATGLHRHLTLDSFIENRAALAAAVQANFATAIVSMAVIYMVAVALSVPGALVLTLAAGFLFGPIAGGVIAAVSATLGATALFLVARGSLGLALRQRAGPRMQRIACGFREDAFNYMLFLRLVPVAPFWLVNLAPALLGVRTRTFVAATAIGILPGTFAFATLGSGLDSVIAAQEAANADCMADPACEIGFEPGALLTPELVAGFAVLGFVSLIPVVVKRLRGARGRS